MGCELGGRSPNGSRRNYSKCICELGSDQCYCAVSQLDWCSRNSLLYLAVQVHRSTRITKLAAQDAATTALRDVTRPFAENPEVGLLWRRGLEDINSLQPDEKARFFHVAFQFLESDGDNSFPLHLRRDGGTGLARLAQPLSALSRCPGVKLLTGNCGTIFSPIVFRSSLPLWKSRSSASPSAIFWARKKRERTNVHKTPLTMETIPWHRIVREFDRMGDFRSTARGHQGTNAMAQPKLGNEFRDK